MVSFGFFIAVGFILVNAAIAQQFSCNFAVLEDYYNGSRWVVPTDTIALEFSRLGNSSSYLGYEFRCNNGSVNGLYNITTIAYNYLNQASNVNYSKLMFNITGYFCGASSACGNVKIRYLDRSRNDSMGTNCSASFGFVDVRLVSGTCHSYSSNSSMMVNNCSSTPRYRDRNCTQSAGGYVDNCFLECESGSNITTTSFQTTSSSTTSTTNSPPTGSTTMSPLFVPYCNAINWDGYAIPIDTCAYKESSQDRNMSLLFSCDSNGYLFQYSYENLNCRGNGSPQNVTQLYKDKYYCDSNLNCSFVTLALGTSNNIIITNNSNDGVYNNLNINFTCTFNEYKEIEVVLDVCLSGASNSTMILGCNSHGDILRYSYSDTQCSDNAVIDIEAFECPKCTGRLMNQLVDCPSLITDQGTIILNSCLSGAIYSCATNGNLIETLYSYSNCSGNILEVNEVVENEWLCNVNDIYNSQCDYVVVTMDNDKCFNAFNLSENESLTSSFILNVCTNLADGSSNKYSNCTNGSVMYYHYSDWNCSGNVSSQIWNKCVRCVENPTYVPINELLDAVNWVQWNGFTFPTGACAGAVTYPLELIVNQSQIPKIIYGPISFQFFCVDAGESTSELLVAVYGKSITCDSDDFHLYRASEFGISNYSCSGFDIQDIINGEISYTYGPGLNFTMSNIPDMIAVHGKKNLLFVNESLLNDTNYKNNNKYQNSTDDVVMRDNNDDESSSESSSDSSDDNDLDENCPMKHEYTFLVFPERCMYDETYNISWKLMDCSKSMPLIYFYPNSSDCTGNYTMSHSMMGCFVECSRTMAIDEMFEEIEKDNEVISAGINKRGFFTILFILISFFLY